MEEKGKKEDAMSNLGGHSKMQEGRVKESSAGEKVVVSKKLGGTGHTLPPS